MRRNLKRKRRDKYWSCRKNGVRRAGVRGEGVRRCLNREEEY